MNPFNDQSFDEGFEDLHVHFNEVVTVIEFNPNESLQINEDNDSTQGQDLNSKTVEEASVANNHSNSNQRRDSAGNAGRNEAEHTAHMAETVTNEHMATKLEPVNPGLVPNVESNEKSMPENRKPNKYS